MAEFRLKLDNKFHRKVKASAALKGITMQQLIISALNSFVKPKTTKRKKTKKRKRKR